MRSLGSALSLTALQELQSHQLEPVTVAVVDSGVDATHPELLGRITSAVAIEENEGAIVTISGDARANADVYGHGTAVASIVTRISPNALILDIRVLNRTNACSGDVLLAGLAHAVEARARVINMSLAAKASYAPQLRELCETAYRQNQLVVAARRNMPLLDDGFPAEFSSSIGVDIGKLSSLFGVLFRPDGPIEFAAHGESIDVAAAGGGRTTVTGTSFATPAVSGLCALLVGAYPDLRPFDVKSALRAFAESA